MFIFEKARAVYADIIQLINFSIFVKKDYHCQLFTSIQYTWLSTIHVYR